MTKPLLVLPLFAGLLAGAPNVAHASLSLAASVGQGYVVSEPRGREATSFMLAPGVSIADIVRIELGVVGALSAVKGGDDDLALQLRPMLVLTPPILPLYVRLNLAFIDPFADDRVVAYGGALGLGISFFDVGVFAEAGLLPRSVADTFVWVLEGRAGVYFLF